LEKDFTMDTTLTPKKPIAETYQDLQNLIYYTIHKFIKTYGGEFDELLSISNYYFVKYGYGKHNGKSNIASWTTFCIWRGMLEHQRKQAIAHRRRPEDFKIAQYPPSNRIDIIDELSEDAKHILSLVFKTPEELLTTIQNKGGSTKQVKPVLRRHLLKIGWSAKQIRESFNQITEAISK